MLIVLITVQNMIPGSPGSVVDEVLLDETPLPLGLLPRDVDALPRRHLGVDVVPGQSSSF